VIMQDRPSTTLYDSSFAETIIATVYGNRPRRRSARQLCIAVCREKTLPSTQQGRVRQVWTSIGKSVPDLSLP